jgi:hypothetical protein
VNGTSADKDMTETWLPELEDPDSRKVVIEAVLSLLTRWGIPESDQASLLAVWSLSEVRGDMLPLADVSAFERAGHLLAIERALLKRYPYQQQRRNEWITSAQEELQYQIPLNLMLKQGLEGIKKVRQVVEAPCEQWL